MVDSVTGKGSMAREGRRRSTSGDEIGGPSHDGDVVAGDTLSGRRGLGIEVRNLRHGFLREGSQDVVRALWNMDLSVQPGTFLSIVGPSGCGKTTLLTLLGGLDIPRLGSVEMDGVALRGPRRDISYMLARDALLPWRSVRRNVEFGLEILGIPPDERRRRSTEWIERVALGGFEDWPIRKLSQGMRQRVAVARTLVMSPRCILMDEPFAALDAQTRVVLQQEFLQQWERERPTVVLITHDLTEAILLSDRVILMTYRPGRVLEDVLIDLPRPRAVEGEMADEKFGEYFTFLSSRLRGEVKKALGLDFAKG